MDRDAPSPPRASGGPWARAGLVLVPFLLAVLLFAPATLGGKVLSASDIPLFAPPFPAQPAGARPENALQYDAAYVFEPDALFVRRALRAGRLPVWSPALASGVPLLADQQSAPLFPLTWIGVVAPFWSSLAWIAVLKLGLAALGSALFARALGLGRWPALLGGVSFAFGSYLVNWLMHPHVNAYVVLPWGLLAAERLCARGRPRDAAALAVATGLAVLGGQPESALLVGLTIAAWTAYRLIEREDKRESALRALLAAGAGLLGLALGAVVVVPFVEALGQSSDVSRSGPPLPLRSVASVLFPDWWGRLDRAGPADGPSNYVERTLFLGVLPTLLAAAGLVARRPRGPQVFFAALTVASLVVALDLGPITDAIRGLPVLDLVNLDRALVLAAFAVAMLAAFGLETLLAGAPAQRRRLAVASGGLALAPVLVAFAAHPGWLADVPATIGRLVGRDAPASFAELGQNAVVRWALLAAASVALIWALARRRATAALAAGAVALTALDLVALGWGFNPAIAESRANPPAPPAVRVLRDLTAGGGRVAAVGALEPNSASRWGLHDVLGHEDPTVERRNRLWFALGGSGNGSTATLAPQDPRTRRLLDVIGARAVLFAPASALATPRGTWRRGDVAYQGAEAIVVRNRSALPEAFVAYGWRPSAGMEASVRLVAAGTARGARDEPVVEGAGPAPATARGAATPARIVARTDTTVTVDVRARAAGQLVLLDTYYPGWRAEVDGRRTPIRAANAAFRAVAVPAGHHRVRFTYRPASVLAGGLVSAAAVLVLLAGVALGARRARAARR